jgi:hypothetical protein
MDREPYEDPDAVKDASVLCTGIAVASAISPTPDP